jgi:radical SAM superfamily enzyme YgiQ (UPF0313 family)
MEWITENLDVEEIVFEDDTFTINKKRVIEFCRQYKERGLEISWSCNARADLEYHTMKEMRKANCRLLIVGYESGNENILKNIKKSITLKQIRDFAKNAKKVGILVLGDFMIGLPGETKETIKDTRRLIKEIKPEILQISVASPFPGTEFYRWCKNNGYLITEDLKQYLDSQGHQKAIIRYPALSQTHITQTVDKILMEYYFSPIYIPALFRQIFRKGGMKEFKRIFMAGRYASRYLLGRVI